MNLFCCDTSSHAAFVTIATTIGNIIYFICRKYVMNPSLEENRLQTLPSPSFLKKLSSFMKSISAKSSIQEKNIAISFSSNLISWACIESSSYPDSFELISSGIGDSLDEYEKCNNTIVESSSEDRIYRSLILDASKTLYRRISIPITVPHKNRKMAIIDALEQQISPTITIFPEEGIASSYIIAFHFQEIEDESIIYNTYIAVKSDIEEAVQTEQRARFKSIDALFPKGACLQAWAQSHFTSEELLLIVDSTMNESVILLLKKGSLNIVRAISLGISSLGALDEEQPNTDQIQELHLFLETISEAIQRIKKEENEFKEKKPLLVLTGPIVLSPLYSSCISQYLNIEIYQPAAEKITTFSHAAEIGGALLGSEKNLFSSDAATSDLLQPAFVDTNRCRKHLLRPFLLLFLASALIASALFFLAGMRRDEIRETGKKEMALFLKNISRFPLFQSEQALIASAEKMEEEELLSALQSEIGKKSTYQLYPNVISLTQLLHSLDTIIASLEKKATERDSSFQLESLKYVMVKRPDKQHQKEKYQIRVDLECTSSSQSMARSFYDELLQSKSIVDTRSDVKWSATNGLYKTSFYLKEN